MICSVADCQKENHANYPTRCWTHRAKKWAEPINEAFIASIRKYSFEAEEAVAEEAVAEETVAEETVAEETVAEKNETQELIVADEEFDSENIVPPMSPRSTTDVATQPEPAIVQELKSERVEINSKPFFKKCRDYLKENAIGTWHETYSIYDKDDKSKFCYKPLRGMSLLRVECEEAKLAQSKGYIRFYWIYNTKDAYAFNDYVAMKLKSECHEVFITPRCRFFFDIDMKLDEMEKCDVAESMGYPLEEESNEDDVMQAVSERIAHIYKDAICVSLHEHGALDDSACIDWMFTTRNRSLEDDGFKISIHLITNLMLSHPVCAAIASDIKSNVISDNAEALGVPEDMVDRIVDAIDDTQYRKLGSLGLPFGTKSGNVSWIRKEYFSKQSYFLTHADQYCIEDLDMTGYNVNDTPMSMREADGDFVKRALANVDNIPDFDKNVFDIETARLKGSCMIITRRAPSFCSVCKRTHDNDNTLQLYFNSESGFATWKCIKSGRKPGQRFYYEESEPVADDEVEAFANRYTSKPVKKPAESKSEPAEKPAESKSEPAEKPAESKSEPAEKRKAKKPAFDMDDLDGYFSSEEDVELSKPKASAKPKAKPGVVDEKLYDLLSCLKADRFVVSAERSPLFGIAVAVRDYSKAGHENALATLIKVCSEKLSKDDYSEVNVITAYAWRSPNRSRDLTMASISKYAKSDDSEAYEAWKAKYKSKSASEETPETKEELEARLGKRWVSETKKICEKTGVGYDKLIEGMLKTIEINGDYCMMDWRDEFVKPINQITHDTQVLLGDFISLAGNWVYRSAEEAAKFAAQIIDQTIVMFANGDLFVRNQLDECEQDGAKRTPASLMKNINFRYYVKDPSGEEQMRSATLDKLMLSYSPMFHRYNRYVSRWDINSADQGTFSMCAPYRGKLLSDDDYNPDQLQRFLDFVLEVICDNDQEKYEFFLDYCEHSIRFKNAKTSVAMIFYSLEKGCGKGTIMKIFNWVFGDWNTAQEEGSLKKTDLTKLDIGY